MVNSKKRKRKNKTSRTTHKKRSPPPKKTKKQKSKKKKKTVETDSDSNSSSSTSRSNSSSSSSRSSSDSEESETEGREKINPYNLVKKYFPIDKLPKELRDKKLVRNMKLHELNEVTDFITKADRLRKINNLETLSRDTKPGKVKFAKDSDDCEKHLHKARFLRFPIVNPKKWFGKKMPKKRIHTFKALPLDFMGADRKVSSKVIGWVHDRTHVLELKHFSSSNIGVSSRPRKEFRRQDEDGASTMVDLDWQIPDTLTKFREALDNFSAVHFMLWPLDCTGLCMTRLMNTYNFCSNAENNNKRLQILRSWFNDVLRLNAERAVNEECILSYSEMETILKETLRVNGVIPDPPLLVQNYNYSYGNQSQNRSQNSFQNRNKRQTQNYMSPKMQQPQAFQPQGFQHQNTSQQFQGQGQNQSQKPRNGQGRNYANWNGLSTCRYFNDDNGGQCKNQQTAKGCIVQNPNQPGGGREYVHLCNKFISAKNAYCLAPHRRKDHR